MIIHMDKGAHFYKCDFQVHTPRDAGWAGGDAVTDAERKTYSEELIIACRRKGLGAIAITDHHDFAFYPHVRDAALAELDDTGHPVPPQDRIVVFPGLELTLTAPNCQALLILDAEFPTNLLPSVLTALAITAAPESASKHATVQRIPQTVVSDLSDLYAKLSAHSHLAGRFIVLPNVTETGHGTMLRSGFANFYKSMPCVGGYTDGPVSKFGNGNRAIVEGRNRDYGFKAIGVFQTSDNRKRNHEELAKHVTWVKWSEPTAEALRQACLAKESRLSQDAPNLPSLSVSSMNVSQSKFLGRLDIDFNQQYNALIGGRGTGKSTILEYLRWGLCDQPVENNGSDIAPVQTKRKSLIDDTLQKVDGEVIVSFLVNDVAHIIKRNSKAQTIVLKIGEADFAPVTEAEVRNLFPLQAYSQKQLSSVAVRIEELKRFVELPVKQQLDAVRSKIRDTEAKIRTAYGDVVRKNDIEADIAKLNLEITSLTKQLESLQKALKGLSPADQETIKQKALYENEGQIVEGLQNEMSRLGELVEALKSEADDDIGKQQADEEIYNVELIRSVRAKYTSKFAEIRKLMTALSKLFAPESLKDIDAEVARWADVKSVFDKKYEAAKAKATANQQQLQQIQSVEKRLTEIKKIQLENGKALKVIGNPDAAYQDLRAQWNELHRNKIEILQTQCTQFSGLSSGLIKADIHGSLDVEALKQQFKTAFAGMNIKDQKVSDLCQSVLTAAAPLDRWNVILGELQKLSTHKATGADALPGLPHSDVIAK